MSTPETIRTLLDAGKRKEARVVYLAHLDAEIAKAQAGETINLTDLIGTAEQFIITNPEGTP